MPQYAKEKLDYWTWFFSLIFHFKIIKTCKSVVKTMQRTSVWTSLRLCKCHEYNYHPDCVAQWVGHHSAN